MPRARPIDPAELEAAAAAKTAHSALVLAIAAYERAGFGSHVTDPLRDALVDVGFSIREVAS